MRWKSIVRLLRKTSKAVLRLTGIFPPTSPKNRRWIPRSRSPLSSKSGWSSNENSSPRFLSVSGECAVVEFGMTGTDVDELVEWLNAHPEITTLNLYSSAAQAKLREPHFEFLDRLTWITTLTLEAPNVVLNWVDLPSNLQHLVVKAIDTCQFCFGTRKGTELEPMDDLDLLDPLESCLCEGPELATLSVQGPCTLALTKPLLLRLGSLQSLSLPDVELTVSPDYGIWEMGRCLRSLEHLELNWNQVPTSLSEALAFPSTLKSLKVYGSLVGCLEGDGRRIENSDRQLDLYHLHLQCPKLEALEIRECPRLLAKREEMDTKRKRPYGYYASGPDMDALCALSELHTLVVRGQGFGGFGGVDLSYGSLGLKPLSRLTKLRKLSLVIEEEFAFCPVNVEIGLLTGCEALEVLEFIPRTQPLDSFTADLRGVEKLPQLRVLNPGGIVPDWSPIRNHRALEEVVVRFGEATENREELLQILKTTPVKKISTDLNSDWLPKEFLEKASDSGIVCAQIEP